MSLCKYVWLHNVTMDQSQSSIPLWLGKHLRTSAVFVFGNTVLLWLSQYESSVSVRGDLSSSLPHILYMLTSLHVIPCAWQLQESSKLTHCQSSSNGCQTLVCCVWINIRTSSCCRFPTILSDLYYVSGRSLSHRRRLSVSYPHRWTGLCAFIFLTSLGWAQQHSPLSCLVF